MKALLLSLALAASGNPKELLETAKRQLTQHKDVEAKATLDRAKTLAGDQPLVLAQIYLYLGLSFAEVADEKHTLEAFSTALKLDRNLQLPADAPPKIVAWWARAGGAPPTKPDEPAPEPPAPFKVEPPAPVPQPIVTEPTGPPPAAVVAPVEKPISVASRASSHWWIVSSIAAAAFAVAGVVLVGQAEGDYHRLVGTAPLSLEDGSSLSAQGKSFQSVGWSLIGIAAVAAISAVLVAVLIDN